MASKAVSFEFLKFDKMITCQLALTREMVQAAQKTVLGLDANRTLEADVEGIEIVVERTQNIIKTEFDNSLKTQKQSR